MTEFDLGTWNWTYICPTGLTPWLPQNKYLAPCFQEICLQLPLLIAFAIVSAYHFGNQTVLVRRNGLQNFLLSIRIMVVLSIVLLEFYKMFVLIVTKQQIWPIDVLLTGFQIVTWFIHMGKYIHSFNRFIAFMGILFIFRFFIVSTESWRIKSPWIFIHFGYMAFTCTSFNCLASYRYCFEYVDIRFDCCDTSHMLWAFISYERFSDLYSSKSS